MVLGINYWFGYPSLPKERVGLLCQNEIRSVAVYWTNEFLDANGDKEEIANQLLQHDIQITSFHTSYDKASLFWQLGEDGTRYRKDIEETISDARRYHVPFVVMHTNGFFKRENISWLIDMIRLAKENCVTLCIENLAGEDNIAALRSDYRLHDVSLCFDVGHANLRQCPFNAFANAFIRYVHLHDNVGSGDAHLLPGEGTIKWAEVCRVIKSCKNLEYGIMEVHQHIATRNEAMKYLRLVKSSVDRMLSSFRCGVSDGLPKS